jgi:hypothetical protein
MQIKGNSAIVLSSGSEAEIKLGGLTHFIADPPASAAATSLGTALQLTSSLNVLTNSSKTNSITQTAVLLNQTTNLAATEASSVSSINALSSQANSASSTDASMFSRPAQNVVASASQSANSLATSYMQNNVRDLPATAGESSLLPSNENLGCVIASGASLLIPAKDTTIITSLAKIQATAGSIVLVHSSANSLSIYNLADAHKEAVVVTARGRSWTIPCGDHTTVTSLSNSRFGEVNPCNDVGYRDVVEGIIGSDLKTFNSEFSISSLINSDAQLIKLFKSSHRSDRRNAFLILKTAASLAQMHQNKAGFTRIKPPVLAAFAAY